MAPRHLLTGAGATALRSISFHTLLYETFSLQGKNLLSVQTVPQSLSGAFLASELIRNLMSADTTAETKPLCNNLVLTSTTILFTLLYVSIYPNQLSTFQLTDLQGPIPLTEAT